MADEPNTRRPPTQAADTAQQAQNGASPTSPNSPSRTDGSKANPSVEQLKSELASAAQSGDGQQQPPPDTGSPMPSEKELDAIDKAEADGLRAKLAEIQQVKDVQLQDTMKRIIRLGTAYPATTPAEQAICGYGGIVLKVGDMRRMAVYLSAIQRGEEASKL